MGYAAALPVILASSAHFSQEYVSAPYELVTKASITEPRYTVFGRSSQRLRNPSEKHVDNFNGDCALFCGLQVFLGCGWILNMTKRKEIRERFGIEGSGCSDCCVSYWCPCCALIQQDNEVKGRLLQEAVTHGYEAQENMQLNQQQNTKY
ncbi:PLAC8 family-domain-containing protein [Dactylonectria macrodidyma]|uniref:PLAC8 family-domain-containing protein n=1 Tax=Dactylonectria macrodidyma TaxID=307937 RepID=A0A9P9EQT8_9HYPO|nr:PLAC8 family-domain-containing protein [Dactylonectria macrodidyma]